MSLLTHCFQLLNFSFIGIVKIRIIRLWHCNSVTTFIITPWFDNPHFVSFRWNNVGLCGNKKKISSWLSVKLLSVSVETNCVQVQIKDTKLGIVVLWEGLIESISKRLIREEHKKELVRKMNNLFMHSLVFVSINALLIYWCTNVFGASSTENSLASNSNVNWSIERHEALWQEKTGFIMLLVEMNT